MQSVCKSPLRFRTSAHLALAIDCLPESARGWSVADRSKSRWLQAPATSVICSPSRSLVTGFLLSDAKFSKAARSQTFGLVQSRPRTLRRAQPSFETDRPTGTAAAEAIGYAVDRSGIGRKRLYTPSQNFLWLCCCIIWIFALYSQRFTSLVLLPIC